MRIRLKANISGLRDGCRWPALGAEINVPDAEGANLCANGLAEVVVQIAAERAEAKAPERRAPKKS